MYANWLAPIFSPAERRAGRILNDLLITTTGALAILLALWSRYPLA